MALLDAYSPSAGLLTDADRKKAEQLGWLNAAANLFNASAPQVGGVQKTPFQLLGTGLLGYAQGTQAGTDRALQESQILKQRQDEQRKMDWASKMAPQLQNYGINQDAASGMSPEMIAKLIVDAENDKRKFAQEEKLANMTANRMESTQRAILEREKEIEQLRADKEKELLDKKLAAIGQKIGPDGQVYNAKPIPATIAKIQDESLADIGLASGLQKDVNAFKKQIEQGNLSLGPVKNVTSSVQNFLGMSDDESRNYASFKASLEGMRNASLRLNKGVQTEGDAVRAWNELFDNLNDESVVKKRLGEIENLNKRAVDLKKLQVDQLREEYGKPQMDYSAYENIQSAYTPIDNKKTIKFEDLPQ